uniref:Uncharacterized protein n=1 Tax=Neobodo designis TaxID=312471 RepID=A0A7S1PVU9_NEODS|mmetsp:Transcript_23866/g.73943  ORF Transcript_23866/g.73943 Transcript_23866/m.73943 type:complete len:240 (+) Transcript_23866:298-1017(+)
MGCSASNEAAGCANVGSRCCQRDVARESVYCATPRSVSASAHALRPLGHAAGQFATLEHDPLHRGYDHAQARATDAVAVAAYEACADPGAHSAGYLVPEPRPKDLQLRITYRVAAAQMHGIDGDPCQFNPGREASAIIAAAERAVREWMPDDVARKHAATVRSGSPLGGGVDVDAKGASVTSMFEISLGVRSFASLDAAAVSSSESLPVPSGDTAHRLSCLALAKHTRMLQLQQQLDGA